jgi:hypothetical protein
MGEVPAVRNFINLKEGHTYIQSVTESIEHIQNTATPRTKQSHIIYLDCGSACME